MAYLNLMILCSRYIFIGFAIVFIVVALSFMKPFFHYPLGSTSSRNNLLYCCITFFHLGASSILVGKATTELMRKEIIQNSIAIFLLISLATILLRLMKRLDQLVLFNIAFFLIDVGYVMLERLDHGLATKQVLWSILGVFTALILPLIYHVFLDKKYRYLYLSVTLVFIVLPFLFGVTEFGATNWVAIGPLSFQPSEIGKLTYICYLAAVWECFSTSTNRKKIAIEASVVTLFILGCLFLQKDLGAALLYFLTFLVLLWMGTKKVWLPLVGILLGAIGSVIGYFAFGHVRIRVEAWLNPWADITGKGYQVVQGLFAIGTWGFLGSGLTRGVPNKIPIVTTDYIFAAICEELGTMFGMMIILCYLCLVLYILKTALQQTNFFMCYLCVGIACLFGFQTFLIIGGVLKLVPLTGITVPFISFGGTSLVMSFQAITVVSLLSYKVGKNNRKVEGTNDK